MRPPDVHIDDLAEPRFSPEAQQLIDGLTAMAPACTLEPEALMEMAVQQTEATGRRMEDFGDEAFREPLEILCRSLREEAGLAEHGKVVWHAQLLAQLTQRLRLQDLLNRHPEIHDVQIERPIIIAGLPRTGTTHLHNLLSADPALRPLPYWEACEPVPPPGEEGTIEPRIQRVAASLHLVHTTLPYLKRMFDLTPTYSHEEGGLLALTFASTHLEIQAMVPSYRDWYLGTDQTFAYEYLRTALKAITWLRGGGRWVLKAPQHLEQLGPLMKVFPDATVVITHRDPVAVTASLTTMLCYGLRMTTYPIDPHAVGAYWRDRSAIYMERCLRDRDLVPKEQSIDVLFHEFMADDIAMVERIYQVAGQPFTEETRAAMEAYMAEHPRGRHGRVDYRLADIGLELAERRRALAPYAERFGTKEEPVKER
ncbi:sulfotransferase family protein [Thermomonospora curvata]|uniref:Sulfotransferase n=1 Tax=Thermomonospora curvata (strain ATCC 19995 / DSM 43183 / JCM 3096 / KCTC 9072 / NBRC 15933 / NCIMB 10081 / Henssen B9) TaxID=471852 RepID=D1A7C1_THECD|nr:sulfotransferase [Thermomonospora curvata]ACZ00327.1 sulfotransferase [Thermomonospora curvata DSM 43183]